MLSKGTAHKYGTIHLAVHAIADRTNPDRACLIFAPEKQSGDDGLLQVREIQNLPLDHTDLVTLSACDTSVGRIEGQEGVSSIVYVFLYAGASSAIASLWTVEDSSTAALMKAFYRHFSAGETKSGAPKRPVGTSRSWSPAALLLGSIPTHWRWRGYTQRGPRNYSSKPWISPHLEYPKSLMATGAESWGVGGSACDGGI
ncbi:MAG: CHAT domain-containing protein [Bryobacteraceae bacterium]